MTARAVIINADDLGLWPAVDDGILFAWAEGGISDSTVLANAPNLTEVLERACGIGLPVGVHLNLTYGRPLCPPGTLTALVTADGAFMKREAWTLPLPIEEVRLELTAQLRRVLDLGWQPSHLDSHHHIHRYPEVLDVVIDLAREHRLPVRSVDDEMRDTLRAAGIATTDAFYMGFYGERATVETLINAVERSEGVLEIMTHPGFSAADLPSTYRADRERELYALISPHWRDYLAQRGIALCGFAALRLP